MKHSYETLIDQTVTLDGNWFLHCLFVQCRLIYTGGALPTLQSCSYEQCEWEFTERAGRVLVLLRSLHSARLEPAKRAIDYILGAPPDSRLKVQS